MAFLHSRRPQKSQMSPLSSQINRKKQFNFILQHLLKTGHIKNSFFASDFWQSDKFIHPHGRRLIRGRRALSPVTPKLTTEAMFVMELSKEKVS